MILYYFINLKPHIFTHEILRIALFTTETVICGHLAQGRVLRNAD